MQHFKLSRKSALNLMQRNDDVCNMLLRCCWKTMKLIDQRWWMKFICSLTHSHDMFDCERETVKSQHFDKWQTEEHSKEKFQCWFWRIINSKKRCNTVMVARIAWHNVSCWHQRNKKNKELYFIWMKQSMAILSVDRIQKH